MLKTTRFLRAYARFPASSIVEEEISIPQEGGEIPATFLRPPGAEAPGWIVLHGITVPGRQHPVMRRFVHALAATGAAVVIPEVAAWRDLAIDIPAGNRAIEAAAAWLAGREDVRTPCTLVGFSFGATQALTAAGLPSLSNSIHRVVGFGGFCDFPATLRFMMTGLHEAEGVQRRVVPDPYGRWIAMANYLPDVPEYAGMSELRNAALQMARESGTIGVFAGDPIYDPMKAELRASIPSDQLEFWDLIAHPSYVTPPVEPGLRLADRLATAAQARHPELDPRPMLSQVEQRVILAHGYDDRLVPYTETQRLREALPRAAAVDVSITRLFSHSAAADPLALWEYPREAARYLRLLNRAL